jgi:hypothetical protein
MGPKGGNVIRRPLVELCVGAWRASDGVPFDDGCITRDTIGVNVFSHSLMELCVGAWRASDGVPPSSKG